jgi:hypothetical protein
MGVDHNAYIGPYLRVTATIQKIEIDYCAEHDRGDAAYCPKCGRSEKDRICKSEGDNAPDEWEENYKEGGFYDYLSSTSMMSGPDTVKGKKTYIYLPNRYYKELGLPDIEGGKYSEEEVPFDELDVPGTIKKFKKLFKDEIKHLKQWFEVEVKFGYIAWCS